MRALGVLFAELAFLDADQLCQLATPLLNHSAPLVLLLNNRSVDGTWGLVHNHLVNVRLLAMLSN